MNDRARDRLEYLVDCLGRALFVDVDHERRFAMVVEQWLRTPVRDWVTTTSVKRPSIPPSPPVSRPLHRSVSTPTTTTTTTRVHINMDMVRRQDEEYERNMGGRRRMLAASMSSIDEISRDQDRQRARRTHVPPPEQALVTSIAAALAVFAFAPWDVVQTVGTHQREPARIYPFGDDELVRHIVIVDTHLTHDEHGVLAYVNALSPLTASSVSNDRIQWTAAASVAFGRSIDRWELVERVCMVVLASAASTTFDQYATLLTAALLTMYDRALRAGLARHHIDSLIGRLRRADRIDVARFSNDRFASISASS